MSDGNRSLHLYPETWRRLNALKRPGETADDVVRRLLGDDVEITPNRYMTINVSNPTKEQVVEQKDGGETFDDVIRRLLDDFETPDPA